MLLELKPVAQNYSSLLHVGRNSDLMQSNVAQ